MRPILYTYGAQANCKLSRIYKASFTIAILNKIIYNVSENILMEENWIQKLQLHRKYKNN